MLTVLFRPQCVNILSEVIPCMVPHCAASPVDFLRMQTLRGLSCVGSPYLPREITNTTLNTLRPRQNGRHFADDIFKLIFLNENVWISIKISLKFVPQGSINNIPTLVQIMAWRRPGDKPLSGPMMFRLPTHICVTRPQWVNPAHCAGMCRILINYS